MKAWLLAIAWIAGISCSISQQVDMDFSGAYPAKVETVPPDRISFTPLLSHHDGSTVWNFRLRQLTSPITLELHQSAAQTAFVSFDSGETWHTVSPQPGDKPTYQIVTPPDKSTCLFASPLPFSHSQCRKWMQSLVQPTLGVEIHSLGTGANEVEFLRVCEGDKVEARRPVILIHADAESGNGCASWLAVGFANWLCGNSFEAVWLRQNVETLIIPVSAPANLSASAATFQKNLSLLTASFAKEERLLLPLQITRADLSSTQLQLLIPKHEPLPIANVFRPTWPLHTTRTDSTQWKLCVPWNFATVTPRDYQQLGVQWGEALHQVMQQAATTNQVAPQGSADIPVVCKQPPPTK